VQNAPCDNGQCIGCCKEHAGERRAKETHFLSPYYLYASLSVLLLNGFVNPVYAIIDYDGRVVKASRE
jgi:hypothetical protein